MAQALRRRRMPHTAKGQVGRSLVRLREQKKIALLVFSGDLKQMAYSKIKQKFFSISTLLEIYFRKMPYPEMLDS